jgi:hypothetical protein
VRLSSLYLIFPVCVCVYIVFLCKTIIDGSTSIFFFFVIYTHTHIYVDFSTLLAELSDARLISLESLDISINDLFIYEMTTNTRNYPAASFVIEKKKKNIYQINFVIMTVRTVYFLFRENFIREIIYLFFQARFVSFRRSRKMIFSRERDGILEFR